MLAVVALAGLVGTAWGTYFRGGSSNATHLDLDDYGLDEATWDGLDDPSSSLKLKPQKVIGFANRTGLRAKEHPKVLMLGLFNTGTNLLQKLLEKNFGGIHDLRGDLEIWKHIKPSHLRSQLKAIGKPNQLKDALILAVVRDPMSWLQSMRKAPYDLGACMRRSDWPTAGCTFPAPHWYTSSILYPDKTLAHKEAFQVQNIESVWNDWGTEYNNLEHIGLGKTVVVTYEEMVMDTEGVLGRIAAALGKPAPKKVEQQHGPAKFHGNSLGRLAAIQKLESKSYLKTYTDKQRHQVCDRLDKALMHKRLYHDCDTWL